MIKKIGFFCLTAVISLAVLSAGVAQAQTCVMATNQTTIVPPSSLLGSVNNAALAVDNDMSTASNLLANVTLVGAGTVAQSLIFPTASAANDSVTFLLGYSGAALQNLAQVSQSVTVETFFGGTSNGAAQPLNASLIKVVNNGSTFTYGFRSAAQYDEVRFTLTPGALTVVGASAQLDIYYGCRGAYPLPSSGATLCSNASSVDTAFSATCVACTTDSINNAIDNDPNSASTITVPASLLGGNASMTIGGFPVSPGTAGDSVEVILGINAALLNAGTSAVTIHTSLAGVSNNDTVTLDNSVLTTVSSNKRVYTLRPTKAYDAFTLLVTAPVLSAGLTTATVDVFGACKKEFRPAPYAGGDVCIGGDQTADQSTAPASVSNPSNVIDQDQTNYSVLTVPVSLLAAGSAAQYVHFQNQGCSGDTIKFVIQDDNGNLASLSALGEIRYQTLNGTTVVDDQTVPSALLTGAQASQKATIAFATTDRYDGFRLILNPGSTAAVNYRLRFYSLCAQPKTPPVIDSVGSTLNICFGSSATLKVNVPPGTTVDWFINPNNPTPLFTGTTYVTPALSSTTVFFARTTVVGSGCSSNILIPYEVVVNRPLPIPTVATNPVIVCDNTSASLVATLPTVVPPLGGSPTISWYDAPTGGNLLTTSFSYNTPPINSSTTYYLTVDSANCQSPQRLALQVDTTPKAPAPVVTCGQTSKPGTIVFDWTPVANSTAYVVDDQGTLINVGDTLRFEKGGQPANAFRTITVYAQVNDACGTSSTSAAVTCQYKECPAIATDFDADRRFQCLPDTIRFLNNTPGAVQWLWDFGDGFTSTEQNPVHSYVLSGFYTVKLDVLDAGGCPGTVTKSNFVQICDRPNVFFPTAFSPNGDGKNDEYGPIGSGIATAEYAIYNQWGEKVFETKTLGVTWDGKKDDTICPEGVYVYRATVKLVEELEERSFKGNIVLIR